MLHKLLWTILVTSLLSQIIFSFYYSSEIINYNNAIDIAQNELVEQKRFNQELESKLAQITSLQNLHQHISGQNFTPVNKYINLTDK